MCNICSYFHIILYLGDTELFPMGMINDNDNDI
jgi:hypothetical protein